MKSGLYFLMLQGAPQPSPQCWVDEFGNKVVGVFSTEEAAKTFCDNEPRIGAKVETKKLSLSNSMVAIVNAIKSGISFYTINPVSREEFYSLGTADLLEALFIMIYGEGMDDGLAAKPNPPA